MNSVVPPAKNSAPCRYFASTGSCFYGEECQFSHEHPGTGPDGVGTNTVDISSPLKDIRPVARDLQGNPLMALDGDQFFTATFSNGNGLPDFQQPPYERKKNGAPQAAVTPEKSLAERPSAGDSESPVPMNHINDSQLSDQFAGLNVTPNKYNGAKGRNAQAPEFVPKTVTPGSLTHSNSSPSFASYSAVAAMNSASPSLPLVSSAAETLGVSGSVAFSTGASPIASPGLSPMGSPLAMRRNHSPATLLQTKAATPPPAAAGPTPQMQMQENIGGTTFFYTEEELRQHASGVVMPNFTMYPGILPHVAHMKPKQNMPAFFMPEEIKMELLQRQVMGMAQVSEQNSDIPTEVDNYHNLFPLEPPPMSPMHKSSTFGYPTTCYKAVNTKDGLTYCLRRIWGFRLVNAKRMALMDLWKKIQHSNIVNLREVFTTKAFGDHSMVFVYDYHPASETVMSRHFSHQGGNPAAMMNGFSSSYGLDSPMNAAASTGSHGGHHRGSSYSRGKNKSEPRQHAGLLPESFLWGYIVQLTSALRTIHAHGLACRVMDPTKILVTDKSRIRLNGLGIFDVLTYDSNQTNPLAMMPHYQQDDLISLGKVILALATNSISGIQQENMAASMDLVSRSYSADLKNLLLYLLTSQARVRSINDIMPMIGARFYTQLDAAQLRNDVLENELSKEVENGRLFKLMAKLGIINERPEFRLDPAWSETGDRYMLKLFRDYLFHQVDENGHPWVDMAHIVQCLNKMDAGVLEKVCLMSRDEQSVLVVTYAELKQCVETALTEVLQSGHASVNPQNPYS